jgi:hypothetical protein
VLFRSLFPPPPPDLLDRLRSFARQLRTYLATHSGANLAVGIAAMVTACGMVLLGPVVIALGEGIVTFGIMLACCGIAGGVVCAIGTTGKSARETVKMLKLGGVVAGVGLGVAVAGFAIKVAGYGLVFVGGALFLVGGAMAVTAARRLSAARQQQLHGAEAEHAHTLARVLPTLAANQPQGEPIPLAVLNLQLQGDHYDPR